MFCNPASGDANLMPRPPSPDWHDYRVKAGLSIRQLEELSGINRGEISRIEQRRQTPTPMQALRLLVALGLAREP